jgi:hypothetical protein
LISPSGGLSVFSSFNPLNTGATTSENLQNTYIAISRKKTEEARELNVEQHEELEEEKE